MKLLVITEKQCDLTDVFLCCPVQTEIVSFARAMTLDLDGYDAFCVLGAGVRVIDARLRNKLEAEADKGKKLFLEAINSFRDIYSEDTKETTRSRLVYLKPDGEEGIPGLRTGDLLDDECGLTMTPWFTVPGLVPLLVYKERIIAHTHTNLPAEEILQTGKIGMFRLGDNILMAMFCMHNYNKARFAPRENWKKLIRYITLFLTGTLPESLPQPPVRYGTEEDLSHPPTWERARTQAIKNGIHWLENFLVDDGKGGLREGLTHNISPDGEQARLNAVRTDCCAEAAGAFAMFAHLADSPEHRTLAENIRTFIQENMIVRKEPFRGMLRWTETAWGVCYPDDAARAMIPSLLGALFLDDDRYFDEICGCLDFLIRITCRDGLAEYRVDKWELDGQTLAEKGQQEHGLPSAHYNAYYHAALLLAYKKCGKPEYLETARKGLETLMGLYPETRREQSETEEMCRLVLPLAVLYEITGDQTHRAFLYRVTGDLEKLRQPFGGYREWDTGYKAICSRESTGECSLLAETEIPLRILCIP